MIIKFYYKLTLDCFRQHTHTHEAQRQRPIECQRIVVVAANVGDDQIPHWTEWNREENVEKKKSPRSKSLGY
jgi:hypothetical protein